MIITKLKGGLGNQMFQYATGLCLAQKNKDKLLLDVSGYHDERVLNSDTPRQYRLDNFNVSSDIATNTQIQKVKNKFGILSRILRYIDQKYINNYYKDYHPNIFNKKGDVYLEGYFQSEKNFEKIREQLQNEFSLKNEISNNQLIEEIKSFQSVCIHIRRGDYVKDEKTNKVHGTCTIEYYKNAIKYISEKTDTPVFYFFSDDIDWVKENFPIDNITMKIGTDNKHEDYEELTMMSYCKHNIIANSSFSWWSAWMNQNPDKIVIAPLKWTNIASDHRNIIPETWIRI